jgi:hypothetical protein
MRLKNVFLGLIVIAVAFGPLSRARADGSVLVVGKVLPRQRQLIVESIVTTAREAGWTLRSPTFSPQEIDSVVACLGTEKPWPCVAPMLEKKGEKLVVVQVEVQRADTMLTMHVLAATNDLESTANQFCNVCNDRDLGLAVANVSRQLLRDSAERSGKTFLVIKSKPDKAWITLDAKPAGSTNVAKATYPGDHTVMLRRDGYVPATKDVRVKEGQTLEIELTLVPSPGTAVGPRDRPVPIVGPSLFVPKLVTGASGAVLLGGILLVAFDEDPSPIGKRHEFVYNTAPLGAAAIITGALGVTYGLYRWVRTSRASKPTSSPTIAPQPGGATVGWAGSF